MTPFTESLRYEYPLTPDSVVMDCGGYMGDFADTIFNRYGCTVHVWEPVSSYYAICMERFKENDKVHVHNCGVGGSTRKSFFRTKGSMAGPWADDGEAEAVELIDIANIAGADLLKLNIEGGEFEVLERLLGSGDITRFKNLQIQFHPVVPNCAERYETIRRLLSLTHELTWDYDWTWQNWKLRK